MKENATGTVRENWSGRWGFILAAAGSAIGLGNIWRFPYITGDNGGAAFILVYILCITIIGVPVMLCEISLGRKTQRNPVGCFEQLTPPLSRLSRYIAVAVALTALILLFQRTIGWSVLLLTLSIMIWRRSWRLVGFMGVLTGFLILSYYSIIGGWSIAYTLKALGGALAFDSVAQAQSVQQAFLARTTTVILYHLLFMSICTVIVYKGVQQGIESACKIMIPLLFLLMLAIIIRALTLPGAWQGVTFCFAPNFAKLSTQSLLAALGQAFFTLSLGMGAMITYGSYLKKDENIFVASGWIIVLDTLVSLLACLMIFPAVFAMGFKPNEGPGLIFQVIPAVFHKLPGGPLWGAIFFTLLSVAALTSGISLQEASVAYLIDERKWSRKSAAIVSGTAIFLVGVLCAISFQNWERLPQLHSTLVACFGSARGSFFDLLDNLTCNWLLPLGGLFICLFTGWVWGVRKAAIELRIGSRPLARRKLFTIGKRAYTLPSIWSIIVRFLCPIAITIVFLNAIGWLK